MDAKKQETLLLFVVAVVGIEHLANLPHDITRLHGAGGPHTPSESEGAGFTVFIFPFLIPRYMATVGEERKRTKTKQKSFNIADLVRCFLSQNLDIKDSTATLTVSRKIIQLFSLCSNKNIWCLSVKASGRADKPTRFKGIVGHFGFICFPAES